MLKILSKTKYCSSYISPLRVRTGEEIVFIISHKAECDFGLVQLSAWCKAVLSAA